MWYFIILIIVALVAFVYIGGIFLRIAIELVFNLPLLYLVYCRLHVHLFKEDRTIEYAIGLIISGLIFVLTYRFFASLPFWPITSFIFLAYLIAELLIWQEAKEKLLQNVKK